MGFEGLISLLRDEVDDLGFEGLISLLRDEVDDLGFEGLISLFRDEVDDLVIHRVENSTWFFMRGWMFGDSSMLRSVRTSAW